MAEVTPVTLLTGLADASVPALRQLEAAGVAVIVAPPLAMRWGGGCTCCSPRDDVARDLRRLLPAARRDALHQVVIAVTGQADPGPILATLLSDTVAASAYRLDGIVAVLDAAKAARTLDARGPAGVQLAMADQIVLTGTARNAAMLAQLRGINPGAGVVFAPTGGIAPALLEPGLARATHRPADLSRWLDVAAYAAADVTESADNDIISFCLRLERPHPWRVLSESLERLVLLHGEAVLRMKAILHVRDEPGPVAIHSVRHLLFPRLRLNAWPPGDLPCSRIALTLLGLRRAEFEAAWRLIAPPSDRG